MVTLGLSNTAFPENKPTQEAKKNSRRRLRRRHLKRKQAKRDPQPTESTAIENVPIVKKLKRTDEEIAKSAIAKLQTAIESASIEELSAVIEQTAGLVGVGKYRKFAKSHLSRLSKISAAAKAKAPMEKNDMAPTLASTACTPLILSNKAHMSIAVAQTPSPSPSPSPSEADADLDEMEDWASSWQQCKDDGARWGGRGRGGRGVARRYQSVSTASRDVLVDQVSLAYRGKTLLEEATLRLVHQRRYGLVGANGVGKTTLLRSIACGRIPGFPLHLHSAYVEQEWSAARNMTPLAALMDMGHKQRREELKEEISRLEAHLETLDDASEEVVSVASRLGDADDLLEELGSDRVKHHALQMLMRMGFTTSMATQTTCRELSGGWRMRLVLARALIHKPDILLLDEPTNHLDLHGVLWLENFLTQDTDDRPTVLLVSHDRKFLEAVATDIIVFEKQQLKYFNGTFSEYQDNTQEKETAASHQFAARMRQETKAKAMIQKLQQSKSKNHKVMKQVKQKMHKINRIGLRAERGKRFKQNSIKNGKRRKKLTDAIKNAVNLGTQAVAPERKRQVTIKLPAPAPLKTGAANSVISLDKVSCGYTRNDGSARVILSDVSLQIGLKSRVAVVGANGAGKSTLLNVLMDKLKPLSGDLRRTSTAKFAMVTQHHTESLRASLRKSALEHLLGLFQAKHDVSALDMRAHLGKFGLTGDLALLPICKLSGGQKVRVSLAALTYERPHVLVMDEPTNHLDMETLDAMAKALRTFEGAVVLVSHNRSFCAAFCKDLWVVEAGKDIKDTDGKLTRTPGRVKVMRGDDDANPFAKLFQQYTASISKGGGSPSKNSGRDKKWKQTNQFKKNKRQTKHMGTGVTSRTGFV